MDFQNDVTTRDLAQAHQEGFESVEHLKRYTTLGMGTDQGKTSNINALRLMASLRGDRAPAAGTTTFRPPYTPVSIGALAGRNVGHHFRPVRRSPLHEWHVDNGGGDDRGGAVAAALVLPLGGRHRRAAPMSRRCAWCAAASGSRMSPRWARSTCRGPMPREFLNRVYVNEFARLAVGKARYGVMLNDDAHGAR